MANFLWTQKQDIGPKSRMSHSIAFDATRHRTVLFGGSAIAGGLFNDTWEWDGKLWTQIADMGPASRSDHAMTYFDDINRKAIILFGGVSNDQKIGDTWEWNGENWTQLSNSGPQPRGEHSMVFDAKRKLVILFGGETNTGVNGDTWGFDGEEWSQLDNSGPSPRKLHSMTYDSIREKVVLFGGVDGAGSEALNDTWEWDGSNWTQVADFGPPPCIGASMAFMNNMAVLFGGASSLNASPPPTLFDNTWGWDGKHWTQFQDIGPGERWRHAAVFDTERKSLILFGGITVLIDPVNPNPVGKLLNDTWEHKDTSVPIEGPGDPNDSVNMIRSLSIEPPVTTAAELGSVLFVVEMTRPVESPQVIKLLFRPQADPQADILEVGLIELQPGTDVGSTSLPSGTIGESADIFAVIDEQNFATATLTIT